ncbi:MAG TPA: ABC transporter substrate-binding protein [Propionibacteriaceae bacterium]|nr:ABC transporter substrate-binding protein [Propionibacteriaceae bacterium]
MTQRRDSSGARVLQLALALVLVIATLGACTPGSPAPGSETSQRLVVGASLEPPTLDPTGSDAASIPQALLYNVYETLLKVDSDGKLQPLLAERWQVSKDRRTYTFTLHTATFASGRAVTAADVVWSVRRIQAGRNVAAASQLAVVRSVTPQDPRTVVFTLARPSNSWLFHLASTAGIVFDSGLDGDLSTTTGGSGPYALDRWTRGSDLALKRNDRYWGFRQGSAAAFEGVTFRYFTDANALNSAMLSGGLDVLSNLQVPQALTQFQDPARYRVITGTTNGEVVMSLNNAAPALSDVRVRRAINHAVDRAALKKTVWNDQGTLIGSMVPPTDPWYEDLAGTYPYDPAKARRLLAEAGYGRGLKLRMRLPVVPYATASGQFVASQLKDVGITVTTDELEFPRWLDTVFTKADYDISIVAHVEPRDLARFADPKYYFRYDNPRFRRLVAQADQGPPAQQVDRLRSAARLLAQDAAADWLFLLPNLVITTARVEGVPPNATTLSFDLTSVTKTG